MEITLKRIHNRFYLKKDQLALRRGPLEISPSTEKDFLIDFGATCCAIESVTLANLTQVDPHILETALRKIKDGQAVRRLSDFQLCGIDTCGGYVKGVFLPNVTFVLCGKVIANLKIFTAYQWNRNILGTPFLDHIEFRTNPGSSPPSAFIHYPSSL